MWRYLVLGVAALLLFAAAWTFMGGRARTQPVLPVAPPGEASTEVENAALPATVPEATAKTREQKRFDRYDKDRDGKVTRDEYLVSRRKAYAKLDTNGDGRLTFDEWALKTTTKFAAADKDKSGAMAADEFATTAVKRSGKPRCVCPPVQPEE
ncbi:EF-hand domain-containing protein [Sphingomonas sp. SUN019]|uniref:EF-hand domain-containing protein n=1 Tax=Sphingomonas sp. SUN019 TaxID=2937788 RepID=UPI00216492B9|nr:EF-hand domain-containing protein [Sphingomonas sp. SUN019]UVO49145.1 EF-hand domain-containing protein [Sphingomonas sp. SUN019]